MEKPLPPFSRISYGKAAPVLALALGVMAVGWAAVLVRLLEGVPSEVVAAWRMTLASLLLIPLALGHSAPVFPATQGPHLSRGRLLAWTLGVGVLLAWHFAAWFASLRLTSIASSTTLVTTTPVFAAILAPLILGERTPRQAWTGVVLALLGALLLGASDLMGGSGGVQRGREHGGLSAVLLGDGLALSAALAASLYFTSGRALRFHLSLTRYFATVTGAAALILMGGCLITGASLTGFSTSQWLGLVAMAAVPHLMGHGLFHYAGRHLPAQRVQVALLGEPLCAIGYAWLLFSEVPPPLYPPAAVLILWGVVLTQRPGPAHPPAGEGEGLPSGERR